MPLELPAPGQQQQWPSTAVVNGGCGNGIFAAAINNDDNAMALSAMVFIVDFVVLWRWSIVAAEMAVIVSGGCGGRLHRRRWQGQTQARADEGARVRASLRHDTVPLRGQGQGQGQGQGPHVSHHSLEQNTNLIFISSSTYFSFFHQES